MRLRHLARMMLDQTQPLPPPPPPPPIKTETQAHTKVRVSNVTNSRTINHVCVLSSACMYVLVCRSSCTTMQAVGANTGICVQVNTKQWRGVYAPNQRGAMRVAPTIRCARVYGMAMVEQKMCVPYLSRNERVPGLPPWGSYTAPRTWLWPTAEVTCRAWCIIAMWPAPLAVCIMALDPGAKIGARGSPLPQREHGRSRPRIPVRELTLGICCKKYMYRGRTWCYHSFGCEPLAANVNK